MIEITRPEVYVIELDGFLNAVRCLVGNSTRSFGATYHSRNGLSLDEFIDQIISSQIDLNRLKSKKNVDFTGIQNVFNKYIYSKLSNIDEIILGNVDWSLVEYYGLISTAENENGVWNKLVSQKSYLVEYNDDEGNDASLFVVEFDDFFVLTYFG